MTAKEYFKHVRRSIGKMNALACAIQNEEKCMYTITGIDPSKEKVTGGKKTDLSDKFISVEEHCDSLKKEFNRLHEIARNCDLRIRGMLDENGKEPEKEQMILCYWAFSNLKASEIAAAIGESHSQNMYRKLNKALDIFTFNYERELRSMQRIS